MSAPPSHILHNFQPELMLAKLIKREKRFTVYLESSSGDIIKASCPNTGSMRNVFFQDAWAALSPTPHNKLPWRLEMIKHPLNNTWIGVNTLRANSLFLLALRQGLLPDLSSIVDEDFKHVPIKREVLVAKGCRADFLISPPHNLSTVVEVKNVTLSHDTNDKKRIALFPDCTSVRASKHLKHLIHVSEQTHARAALVFVVQRDDCTTMSAAHDYDKLFAETFDSLVSTKVHVLCIDFSLQPDKIVFGKTLPIAFNNLHGHM